MPFLVYALATLGSASNCLAFPNLAALSLYPRRLYSTAILAIYDSDPAGDLARAYLSLAIPASLFFNLPLTTSLTFGEPVVISELG